MSYWFSDTGCPAVPTALALLFLARGRNPVAFSKLEYAGNTWNARPQDLANLTRWMSGQFERAINWQTVSMTSPPADPEEWLDSPVLLITGSQDPKFTDEQVAKLRRYVELGGTIFSSTDGGGLAFTNAVKKYASQICSKRYQMRDLPLTHPIFSTWGKLVSGAHLVGMSNGVREVWVHSPNDLGASWQRRAYAMTDQWTLPANVFFYAAGPTESLLPRLRSLRVDEAPAGEVAVKVTIGRLEHAGNWDPEPGAWGRFGKLMGHDARAVVNVVPVKAGELDATRTPVVHLTGTADLELSSQAIDNLKAFIEHGGTLLVDNATGETTFSDSVKHLVASLGLGELTLLPDNDPVYLGGFTGGAKVEEAAFRKFARAKGLGNAKDLLGAKKGERWAVLYAPENITSGLLGTETYGIVGYEPATAIALARNMLFYGASNK
jgi:pimeloyl-ACP methyl ester carboxylesterase